MAFDSLASKRTVEKTINALKQRGINALLVESGQDAMEKIKQLIPEGSEVMAGSSTTLDEIGFTEFLKSGKHGWKNLKEKILAENDKEKRDELRAKSVTAEFFLGSVHAVAESGELLTASNTGSQLAPYVFSSPNVIWVVGTQKIVPSVDEGFKRIREFVFPLEDARMKKAGYSGSAIGKILLFERETMPNRKINLVFVNEKLGF